MSSPKLNKSFHFFAEFKTAFTNDALFFTENPVSQSVAEYSSVTLRCNISVDYQIRFYWTLNGKRFRNSGRRFQKESYLFIRHVDRHDDSGDFKCVAENTTSEFSIETLPARLKVYWIDRNVTVNAANLSNKTELSIGDSLTLFCNATASHLPEIQWFKNGLL